MTLRTALRWTILSASYILFFFLKSLLTNTVESRFLNLQWKRKLVREIRGVRENEGGINCWGIVLSMSHFRSNRDGRNKFACCVIKIQNKLKHNFSRSLYLLQVANVTGIRTKWFQNFQFPVMEGNFFPREWRIGSRLAFRIIRRVFENSGIKLQR